MGKKGLKKKKVAQLRLGENKSCFGRFTKNWYRMPKLTPRDWSGVNLEEVKKDFYQEHPNVKARDEAMTKEYMDQNRISVKGRDCPKPVEAFDEFCFSDGVMDAIKAQNFVKPTPIQSQAIPVALSGRDMVGIADTGSGKTLAFILPAITHILGNNHPRNVGEPEVMVLAPTRELAQQIHQVVVSLGPGINVKSECFYGGAKRTEQAILTEKVFEICIATPGRMVDFLLEGFVKLHRCTFFVLDEADRMLDMGFAPQIKQVIGQARPDRQMLMFSATWPQEIQDLAESFLRDYIRVNIGSLQISANHNITQKLEFCDENDKPIRIVKVMKELMEEEENKTLIFVNSKVDVDVLTLKFRVNGWAAMGLHGSKKQTERDQVFNDFKTGKISILIATDLAARGLDVDDIKYIVNYDFPFCSEDYVHRIGRTGRCDRKGTAITFLTHRDRDKAKSLISVLEEAGQYVPPHLHNLSNLPRLTKKDKKAPPGSKLKKKQIKKIVMKSNVNHIPLGSETNTNKLPDLDDILDPSLIEAATAQSSAKKKKNKRKFDLVVNSEKKVQVVESQPGPSKKAKTDLQSANFQTNPSNKFTDDYYSDNFENPHWAPSASSEKYEENSRNTLSKNFSNDADSPVTDSMSMHNSDMGVRDRQVRNNSESQFHDTPVSADSTRGSTIYSLDNRNTSMPMNSRNYETSMGPRSMRTNFESQFHDTAVSADVTRGSSMYSLDNRNAGMPMNSRNYETSMGPRNMGPSMNAGGMGMSKDPVNTKMPMGSVNMRMSANAGSTGMHTNSRSMQSSFSARYQTEGSFDQGWNNMGWNEAPSGRNPTYNNYTSHQTSNWGPYRNNHSMNRMDMNRYPGQNWSGGSGYHQY